MSANKENFPERGEFVDRNSCIEIREFYNGNSSTIWKAMRGNNVIAAAKDRVTLIRRLNKTYG